jgi:hypothetical protein
MIIIDQFFWPAGAQRLRYSSERGRGNGGYGWPQKFRQGYGSLHYLIDCLIDCTSQRELHVLRSRPVAC